MAWDVFKRLKKKFTDKVDPTTQAEINSATADFYKKVKGEDGYVDITKLDAPDTRKNAYTAFTDSINTALEGRGLKSTASDPDMQMFQTNSLWYGEYGFMPTELKLEVEDKNSALSPQALTQIFGERIEEARKRHSLTPYQSLEMSDKPDLIKEVKIPGTANTDKITNIADLVKIDQAYSSQPYNQFSRMLKKNYDIDVNLDRAA